MRLYDPTDGAVLLDGIDLRQMSLTSLRAHIAVVTQETFLLHATVLENLRYGNPSASLARDRGRGPARADPRSHRRAAGRLRHAGRRARLPLLGGRAAAARDRAGDPEGSAHPDSRRGHERARLRVGAAGAAIAGAAARRTDERDHRAPAVHHPRCRPDPRPGPRRRSSNAARMMSCWRETGAMRGSGVRRRGAPGVRLCTASRASPPRESTSPSSQPIRADTSPVWCDPATQWASAGPSDSRACQRVVDDVQPAEDSMNDCPQQRVI